jgi:hypothetical protein
MKNGSFMKKNILVVVLLQCVFVFAQGQLTSEESALLEKQNAAIANSEKASVEAKESLAIATDAASSWASSVAKGLGVKYTETKNGILNFGTKLFSSTDDLMNKDSDAQKALRERTETARLEKQKATEARNEASVKISSAYDAAASALTAVQSVNSANVSTSYATARLAAKDKAMATYIKSVGLTSSFASFSNRYSSVNDAMIVLERNLDKSTLAVYLEEKMRKMLSSDVMCKAISSCKKGVKKSSAKVISTSDLNSVFSGSTKQDSKPVPAATTK